MYGAGKDYSKDEWLHLGRELLHQGLLRETQDGFRVLRLNTLSKEILRKQRTVQVAAFPTKVQPQTGQEKTITLPTSDSIVLEPESARLFHHLRNLRKQLADDQGVPPYVIFPDTALRAMAQLRPQTRAQFAAIPGVGSHKLEAYYTTFTSEIRHYCQAHNLSLGLEPQPESTPNQESAPPVPTSTKTLTHYVTLELYSQGLSIEEIAQKRNLKPTTVIGHLCELLEAGESIDVKRLLEPECYEVIRDAWHKVGGNSLRPVKDYLGDEYSFDEIRLVRAFIRNRG
jgi:ATP-dependent DNA helicase RecQ